MILFLRDLSLSQRCRFKSRVLSDTDDLSIIKDLPTFRKNLFLCSRRHSQKIWIVAAVSLLLLNKELIVININKSNIKMYVTEVYQCTLRVWIR
jgi:hypothetical protein